MWINNNIIWTEYPNPERDSNLGPKRLSLDRLPTTTGLGSGVKGQGNLERVPGAKFLQILHVQNI